MAAEVAARVAHPHCSQNGEGTVATSQEKKNCAGPYYPTDNHSIQMIVRLLPDLVQNLGRRKHDEGHLSKSNGAPDEEHPQEYELEHCFVDLGSGDGRVVREMWNRFGPRGKHQSLSSSSSCSPSSFRAIGVEYDRKVLEKDCGLVFEEGTGTLRDRIEEECHTSKHPEKDVDLDLDAEERERVRDHCILESKVLKTMATSTSLLSVQK